MSNLVFRNPIDGVSVPAGHSNQVGIRFMDLIYWQILPAIQ